MSTRELAAIAFRTLAVWLFASGVGGLSSALLTWTQDVAEYGPDVSAWRLAAASVFVPIGALLWLGSDAAAKVAFSATRGLTTVTLSRADLYAFASVLVGLYLLSDVLPRAVYWVVIWRSARGTGFWEAGSSGTMPNTVVYWVHARAEGGLVAAKAVLGLGLLLGPERLKAGVVRIRREFAGSLSDEALDGDEENERRRDGV